MLELQGPRLPVEGEAVGEVLEQQEAVQGHLEAVQEHCELWKGSVVVLQPVVKVPGGGIHGCHLGASCLPLHP